MTTEGRERKGAMPERLNGVGVHRRGEGLRAGRGRWERFWRERESWEAKVGVKGVEVGGG